MGHMADLDELYSHYNLYSMKRNHQMQLPFFNDYYGLHITDLVCCKKIHRWAIVFRALSDQFLCISHQIYPQQEMFDKYERFLYLCEPSTFYRLCHAWLARALSTNKAT